MPLMRAEDCFSGDMNAVVCVHCADETGQVKPCDEVFEGGVQFFMGATGAERNLAERLTRKNMLTLDYWKEHGTDCLKGDCATDEEFQAMMDSLRG